MASASVNPDAATGATLHYTYNASEMRAPIIYISAISPDGKPDQVSVASYATAGGQAFFTTAMTTFARFLLEPDRLGAIGAADGPPERHQVMEQALETAPPETQAVFPLTAHQLARALTISGAVASMEAHPAAWLLPAGAPEDGDLLSQSTANAIGAETGSEHIRELMAHFQDQIAANLL